MQLGGKYEVDQEELNAENGIFKFTNPTEEDFIFMWNNKEYTYPAQKTVIMFIENESPERVQSIRKMAAKRLAEREYYKGKDFKKIANGLKDPSMGRNVIQSSIDESNLQPFIDSCLKPMELANAKVRKLPEEKLNVAGKAIGGGNKENPYPTIDLNETFKESNEKLLAKGRS